MTRQVLLLVAGCVPYETPCAVATFYRDGDADGFGDLDEPEIACEPPPGFVTSAGDCDDRASGIRPGADEACNGLDDDCDGEPDDGILAERFLDRDGDGFGDDATARLACVDEVSLVTTGGDCDDLDPLTWPGADERCDERDNDCDLLVDEDLGERWYTDSDGDGRGRQGSAVLTCDPWPGAVLDGGDCDDTDPATYPGAVEVCGGDDEDCDGLVDEDPADGLAWYPDGDGDGFGSADAAPRVACANVPGEVLDASDCDDTDAAVHPGVPYYEDDDLDGLGAGPAVGLGCGAPPGHSPEDTDCDDADPTVGPPFEHRADTDSDGFGAGPPLGPVCVLPPATVADGGPDDCDDADPGVNPLALEVCGDGTDQDCTGLDPACPPVLAGLLPIADAAVPIDAAAGADLAGFAVLGPLDLDGDGRDDVVAGAPGADGDRGAAFVLRGPVEAPSSLAGADASTGEGIPDQAGFALGADDLDRDGLPDLVVGAPGALGTGAVYVVAGPASAASLAAAAARIDGTAAGDEAGAAVLAPGDLDGDGVPDLVVGAPGADWLTRTGSGRASVVLGPFTGPVALSGAPAAFVGATDDDRLGAALAPAGDTDGDGVVELWLGAPDDGSGDGEAFLVSYAPGLWDTTGWSVSIDGVTGDAFGAALLGRIDLDGDGYDDLVAGAPASDRGGASAGTVHLFLAPFSGTIAASAADALLDGAFALERAGTSLASVDGLLAVGAPASDGLGALVPGGPGRVYVVPPPVAGADVLDAGAIVILEGATTGEALGYALASAGDADHDGDEDLLVGAPLDGGGTVWLLPTP